MNSLWLLAYLVVVRFLELALSRRNSKLQRQKGGREHFAGSYYELVVLHVVFLISLVVESYPWQVPADTWTVVLIGSFVLLQVARYWCIWSLGPYWNTRIIVVPGKLPPPRGPYRFMRHPNYLVVVSEFLIIPLLLRAPITLVIFFTANLLLIQRRIKREERALAEKTDYREVYK